MLQMVAYLSSPQDWYPVFAPFWEFLIQDFISRLIVNEDWISIYQNLSLSVHYMFTIGSLYVHYMFTVYSLYVHCMFTVCSLYVHSMFTVCSLHRISIYQNLSLGLDRESETNQILKLKMWLLFHGSLNAFHLYFYSEGGGGVGIPNGD